jgi:hypothetical protein
MKRLWAGVRVGVLTAVVVSIAACGGSDGGRDETVLAGNVRSASGAASTERGLGRLWQLVRVWWRAEAVAQAAGVRVSIDGLSASGLTDAEGLFRIAGTFFGPAVVRFTGNGADAAFPVTFPAGGLLQLDNVDLSGGTAKVETQHIQLSGPFTGIDCQGSVVQVLSGELVAFRVRLQPTTAIVDEGGQFIECDDLVTSRQAKVTGILASSGNVRAELIVSKPGVPVPTATVTPVPTSTTAPTATRTPTP